MEIIAGWDFCESLGRNLPETAWPHMLTVHEIDMTGT